MPLRGPPRNLAAPGMVKLCPRQALLLSPQVMTRLCVSRRLYSFCHLWPSFWTTGWFGTRKVVRTRDDQKVASWRNSGRWREWHVEVNERKELASRYGNIERRISTGRLRRAEVGLVVVWSVIARVKSFVKRYFVLVKLRQHISSFLGDSKGCTCACEWCVAHVYDVACLLVVDSNAATSQRMGSCATSTRTIKGLMLRTSTT